MSAVSRAEAEACVPMVALVEEPLPQKRRSLRSRRLRVCAIVGVGVGVIMTLGTIASIQSAQAALHPLPSLALASPNVFGKVVVGDSRVVRSGGYVEVSGVLQNLGRRDLRRLEAIVELLGVDGRSLLLATALVDSSAVGAQGESAFRVMAKDLSGVQQVRLRFRRAGGNLL